MGPTTSIIIPNLDSPFIAATLQALRAQDTESSKYEIVVVGRDSPRMVPRDGSIVFVETVDAVGPGEARNRGVAAARGEFLLFTDADCRPAESWIDRIVFNLSASPVVGGSVEFSLTGNCWSVGDNIASFHELLKDRPAGPNQGPVGTLNLGVTRHAWDRVGPFDISLATSEDYDWFLRARALGLDVHFDPQAVVEHGDVRETKHDLERHATWYGRNFLQFCHKHPGVFAHGPTWKSRRTLAITRPLKSWLSAMQIFARHSMIWPAWRAFPAVVAFKSAWYQAILDSWQER